MNLDSHSLLDLDCHRLCGCSRLDRICVSQNKTNRAQLAALAALEESLQKMR